MTQCQRILDYMKTHGEITQRDAIGLGCYRLGARIWDLRAAGEEITSTLRPVKNADGSMSRIAVYALKQ